MWESFLASKGLVSGVIRDTGVAGTPSIAAIAKRHDLTVLTRNVKHYVPFGVAARDPVDRLPPE
jgi:hypothetical protein